MHNDLTSQRVTVMGLGRFGGGGGVTQWLAAQGADVLLTDMLPPAKLREPLAELQPLIDRGSITLRLGEHNVADFTTCDLVIANPAVPRPWENRFLRAAAAAGIPVTTEIRLLTERINRDRVIGVTGSAGKSTTSAMIHHLLTRLGLRSHFGGNIGGTLLNKLHEIQADDWIVLELSSAMLHWLGAGVGFPDAPGWSPHVAVITNITPNHLDWHGSFEHYRESKLNITRYQRDGDVRVTSDELRVMSDQTEIPLKIPGEHNQANARMAMHALARALNEDHSSFVTRHSSLLSDFPGLPHRLQLVAERDGCRFYNDSKCTTPEATVLAVEAFDDPRRVHLIAGGYDKKVDLAPIAQLAPRLAGLYTIGATGQTIADAAAGKAMCCGDLAVAVDRAMNRMQPGDVLLLSPGCASWDQFTNYEQRGEAFIRLVAPAQRVAAQVVGKRSSR